MNIDHTGAFLTEEEKKLLEAYRELSRRKRAAIRKQAAAMLKTQLDTPTADNDEPTGHSTGK